MSGDAQSLQRRPTLLRSPSYVRLIERFERYLTNNQEGLIDHPLRYIPRHKLRESLKPLLRDLGTLVTLDELEESAILARQEHALAIGEPVEDVELTRAEEEALDIQRSGVFWREPKDLLLTLAVCCLASMVQGWDGVANGNLRWPVDFNVQVDPQNRADQTGTWRFAIVQAVPWLSASILGSFLSDPLSEYTGRRKALVVAGLCSFTSSIAGSRATSWKALLGTRVLLGLGIGGKASIVPVLESEVLPSSKRGRLLVSWQVFDAVGIFLGSIACYILRDSWRSQILSGAIPAFALLLAVYASCESPRWLVTQGQYERAFTTLLRLRKERRLALKELISIQYQTQMERAILIDRPANVDSEIKVSPLDMNLGRSSWWHRLGNMIYLPRVRRAAIAAMVVMICQQLSGINIYAFLATQFYTTAGLAYKTDYTSSRCYDNVTLNVTAPVLCGWSNFTLYNNVTCYDHVVTNTSFPSLDACQHLSSTEAEGLRFSIGFGLANVLFSCSAYFLIENDEGTENSNGEPSNEKPSKKKLLKKILSKLRGRRSLLLMSFAAGIVTLLLTSQMFRIKGKAREPLIILFTVLFTAFYSPGAGVVPFLYCAEIFPNEGRELGMSWATFWNFLGAGIVALAVPFGINWGHGRLLGLFSGLNAVALILVWFCVYGTNSTTTLEDFSCVFGVRMRDHVREQAKRLSPWRSHSASTYKWQVDLDQGMDQEMDQGVTSKGSDKGNYHQEDVTGIDGGGEGAQEPKPSQPEH